MTDLDPALQPAIRAALIANELGGDFSLAYRLSFAGEAASGASFGLFQNDCAANPHAFNVLQLILTKAKMPSDAYGRIIGALRSPCRENPLSASDTALVNAALDSNQGRPTVDAIDQLSLNTVLAYLGLCLDTATSAGKTIAAETQIAMALWCNMSGRPTELLEWLSGKEIWLGDSPFHPAPNPVTWDSFNAYLQGQEFWRLHGKDWPHFAGSVQAGVELLANAA